MRQEGAFAPLYLRGRQPVTPNRSRSRHERKRQRQRSSRSPARSDAVGNSAGAAAARRGRAHGRGDRLRQRRAGQRSAACRSGCPTASTSRAVMAELQQIYARRGVNLVRVGDAWAFRTAPRSRLPDEPRRRAAEEAVARRARGAGHHRLPPAGHPRRDRGHSRRRDLQGHARHAAGDRLGAHARPPPDARAARSPTAPPTRSSIISASRRSATCRAWRS